MATRATARGETASEAGREAERVLRAARAARRGVRREGNRELPLGPKARRTRATLLAAAYDRFVERGYRSTSVADIAEAAGVSLGTFYQYFRDRKDVMGTLVAEAVLDALSRDEMHWDLSAGAEGLRRVIASFVRAYASTTPFQAVWEEVTVTEPELAELRRELSRYYVRGIERQLRRAQAKGLVRNDLDPGRTALALNAMVDRYCHFAFVLRIPAEPVDVDSSVDELTSIWLSAIGFAADGVRT